MANEEERKHAMTNSTTTSVADHLVKVTDVRAYGQVYADRYGYKRQIDARAEEREWNYREAQARRLMRRHGGQPRTEVDSKTSRRASGLGLTAVVAGFYSTAFIAEETIKVVATAFSVC